jgi:hypothetical protein
MGNELRCTVRLRGKKSTGTALLETNEIVFRGDTRLEIPLSLLTSVSSRDGELHLQWSDGEAVFELGTSSQDRRRKTRSKTWTGDLFDRNEGC